VLILLKYVSETDKVFEIDMTDKMLNLFNANREKSGVKNDKLAIPPIKK
jgi:hypothetical protein